MIDKKWALGLEGGAVIANPVPEADAMNYEEIEQVIAQTIEEAEAKQIQGKDVTPFVLEQIQQKTNGRSLATNIALDFHNAKVAAQIATAFSQQ